MPIQTLSAATIAEWEREAGPCPIHGVALELSIGADIETHRHPSGQLMFANTGVMTVSTMAGSWVVSPQRAVWVPEHVEHKIKANTTLSLRNLLIRREIAPLLPTRSCVISVSSLLRELILSAVEEGPQYFRLGSREERIVNLIVDEFQEMPLSPLHLPEPTDKRLRRICTALRENPADDRTLEEWSKTAGGSSRTLARLFVKETGMTFAHWRRQLRLLEALARLGAGQPVNTVALDTGYESPSAFIEMFRRTLGQTPGQYFA